MFDMFSFSTIIQNKNEINKYKKKTIEPSLEYTFLFFPLKSLHHRIRNLIFIRFDIDKQNKINDSRSTRCVQNKATYFISVFTSKSSRTLRLNNNHINDFPLERKQKQVNES